MKTWLGVACVLVRPDLAGCGGSSTTTVTTPAPSPRSVSAAVPDGLTATLAEDKSSIPVGGTVTYTLTLANTTAQPITYQPVIGGTAPSGGVPASLIVKDPQGNTAFPVGEQPSAIFIGPSTTLTPGQSVSGTLTVGGSNNGGYSAAGRYSASATFTIQAGQNSSSLPSTTVGPLEVVAH